MMTPLMGLAAARLRFPLAAVCTAVLLAGCANLAPKYQRPAAPVPATWQDTTAAAAPAQPLAAIDTGWRDFVVDARLRDVVALALDNNRDLRVALQNVEVARAAYRVQRADQFPEIDAGGSLTRTRTPATGSTTGRASTTSTYKAELGTSSFELDLFGRMRNLSDAALQAYFAKDETRRSTQITLVAETASAWLTLAADQQQLALARQTLASRQRTYDVQAQAKALGEASGLTVAQARSSLETARVSVASYQSQVKQDLNALQLLTGATVPERLLPVPPASYVPAAAATLLVDVPAGLPSSVLLQRPDVLSAERTLMADNANIGAARAAFFPTVSLTASAGTASTSLGQLFAAGSGAWSFVPSITLPIFDMGRLQASLDSARAQQAADVASYEKAIQTAFREVADALAVRSTLDEQTSGQTAMVEASRTSLNLSTALQREGSGSFLDVLDAQRTLFSAEQTLISLRLTEQLNRVTLYKVLGGGVAAGTP
ncbi:MAG: Outer membrane protein OprM [Paracidovorax wautersii]|uniref:Outer membrane protein OprM n=1 Tax=Paracidovorax wautersii TaxID=1177982 RepID=A0A7V8JQ62_9BURK|nr:MAG: Outer membrane protein OprM [Paracidovorax wautersii]